MEFSWLPRHPFKLLFFLAHADAPGAPGDVLNDPPHVSGQRIQGADIQ